MLNDQDITQEHRGDFKINSDDTLEFDNRDRHINSLDKDANDLADQIEVVDMSQEKVDKVAKMYFTGSTAIGKRDDIRKLLEEKVVGRIGLKGKYITDKLFELIEGVKAVDRVEPVLNKEGKVIRRRVRYYQTPPSLPAIMYALNRVLGQPTQKSVTASFSLFQLLNDDGSGNKSGQGGDSKV